MKRQMLTEVMNEYFDESSQKKDPINMLLGMSTIQKALPLKPTSFTWERVSDPNRLMKTYEFNSHFKMSNFIQELLIFQEEYNHHGKITIDFPKVIVEVYTHDVNDVTELDLDYAKAADQIRQDVSYYSEGSDYEF